MGPRSVKLEDGEDGYSWLKEWKGAHGLSRSDLEDVRFLELSTLSQGGKP